MALRTQADYYAQLRALLPPGPAWDAQLVAEVDGVLKALAAEPARLDARGYDLMNEADPATVHELVPDWERVMGLPDPCLGESPTFDDRKIAVRQRLVSLGAQTPAYYLRIAASQGYQNARIVQHRAPRFGRARFGSAHFGTWAAQFMWTLYTGARFPGGRRFGASYWGERFGVNSAHALECLIHRAAPAHTVERIIYEEAP